MSEHTPRRGMLGDRIVVFDSQNIGTGKPGWGLLFSDIDGEHSSPITIMPTLPYRNQYRDGMTTEASEAQVEQDWEDSRNFARWVACALNAHEDLLTACEAAREAVLQAHEIAGACRAGNACSFNWDAIQEGHAELGFVLAAALKKAREGARSNVPSHVEGGEIE